MIRVKEGLLMKCKNLKRTPTAQEILDEIKDDTKRNPMKIISFTIQNMNEPLIFLNCFCPSTKREYFIQTDKKTCHEAKARGFGLDDVEFVDEW